MEPAIEEKEKSVPPTVLTTVPEVKKGSEEKAPVVETIVIEPPAALGQVKGIERDREDKVDN